MTTVYVVCDHCGALREGDSDELDAGRDTDWRCDECGDQIPRAWSFRSFEAARNHAELIRERWLARRPVWS